MTLGTLIEDRVNGEPPREFRSAIERIERLEHALPDLTDEELAVVRQQVEQFEAMLGIAFPNPV